MKAKKPIETLILAMRGQKVILDADLAAVYGVATKVLNQAVKRNAERFPQDFLFELTPEEVLSISQIVTSETVSPDTAAMRSQIVTASKRNIRYRPWAFTEHGALMAASVLNSKEAVEMSVFVIRAFVRAREQLAANAVNLKRLAEIDRTLLAHDTALRDVYRKLLPLLQSTPAPPQKGRIGFNREHET